MKTTCSISVTQDKVPRTCLDQLTKLYPAGRKYDAFYLDVPEGHPVIPKVIKAIESYGLKVPPNCRFKGAKGFLSISYHRDFEESDLVEAPYLEIRVKASFHDYAIERKRTREGNLIIQADSITRRHAVVGDMGYGIMVSDTVREALMKESFLHLKFHPCMVAGEGKEFFDDLSMWELTSDLILPWLSPDCKLYDDNGQSVAWKTSHVCGVNDDLHVPTQLRYRSKDLKSVAPFDVALTRERFGNAERPTALVASQRFYQFCVKKKYKIFAVPVRVDTK